MSGILLSLKNGSNFLYNTILNGIQPITQVRNLGYINRMMLKDIKRREMLKKFAGERVRLEALEQNRILPKAIKETAKEENKKITLDASLDHINNRCGITSKAASCLSRWRISRNVWRDLADYNQMSGVTRAVWGTPTSNAITFVYKGFKPKWYDTQGYRSRTVINNHGKKVKMNFQYVN